MNQDNLPPLPEPREMDGPRWGYDLDDLKGVQADAFEAGRLAAQPLREATPPTEDSEPWLHLHKHKGMVWVKDEPTAPQPEALAPEASTSEKAERGAQGLTNEAMEAIDRIVSSRHLSIGDLGVLEDFLNAAPPTQPAQADEVGAWAVDPGELADLADAHCEEVFENGQWRFRIDGLRELVADMQRPATPLAPEAAKKVDLERAYHACTTAAETPPSLVGFDRFIDGVRWAESRYGITTAHPAADAALHVCPRHDFDIVPDAAKGCEKCNVERLAAHPVAGEPAGWKLVPVQPDEDMVRAMRMHLAHGGNHEAALRLAIDAAPDSATGGKE